MPAAPLLAACKVDQALATVWQVASSLGHVTLGSGEA